MPDALHVQLIRKRLNMDENEGVTRETLPSQQHAVHSWLQCNERCSRSSPSGNTNLYNLLAQQVLSPRFVTADFRNQAMLQNSVMAAAASGIARTV